MKKKKIPTFRTDEEAEHFVDTADLSEYDLSGGKLMRFEFENKSAQLNMRLPKPLLDAVKARAKVRGVPYTRFVREALERVLDTPVVSVTRRRAAPRTAKASSHQAKSR